MLTHEADVHDVGIALKFTTMIMSTSINTVIPRPLCAPQQCQAQHQLVDHTLHHAIGSHTNQLISRSATPDNITTCTMGAAQVPAYGTTTSTVAKDNHIDTTDQPVHSPTNLSKLDAPKRKADASREKSMAKSMCKLQLFDPTRVNEWRTRTCTRSVP